MPLGNQNNSNNKPYFLRIRTQDKDKQPIPAEFSVTTKNEAGEYENLAPVKKVTGDLVSIKIGKRTVTTPAGKTQEVDDVKIILEDKLGEEVYFVDARPSLLTRNLYNSLLNLPSAKGVSISLFQSKPKDDGKVYPGIAVWQGDNLIKGKFPKEEVPLPFEVKNKKGEVTQRDYDEVNEFYFEKLKDLVAALPKGERAPEAEAETHQVAEKAAPKKGKKKAVV